MSATEALEFRVLGPMALEVGGRSLALPGIRPRRLLACLVLHVGRSASVASLVDAVWGDDPPPSAAASLQSHVSRLRIRLGPGVLAWTAHGYRLDVDAATVDARRFEELIGQARGANRPEAAIRALDAALALWRGEPYPDLAHPARPGRVAAPVGRRRRCRGGPPAGAGDPAGGRSAGPGGPPVADQGQPVTSITDTGGPASGVHVSHKRGRQECRRDRCAGDDGHRVPPISATQSLAE